MPRSTGFAIPLLLALVLAAAPLSAQEDPDREPPDDGVSAEVLIEAARTALVAGQPEDAAVLLEGVPPGEGNADDLDFLHGSIAMQRGDWPAAIARFRAMLARNPDLPRVRLDLALAYFQAGEDRNAARHFRLALGAGNLPEEVRANALAFLDRIRRRKGWSVTGSLALAPDTNINTATDARQIPLSGVPATLSDDARRTSDVGVAANLYGSHEERLSPDLRFRVGGGLRTRTYRKSEFSDRILSLRAGPRFLFGAFDLRAEGTVRQRWVAGDTYSRAQGLELTGSWLAGPTWRLGATLRHEWVDYEGFLGTGTADAAGIDLVHALGQATLLQADAGWSREALDQEGYSWRAFTVGLSVSRELPRGFVASGGATHVWRRYGAPLLWLGPDARRDRTLAAWVRLSNRYVELFGFMPEITVRHERRKSNLVLYDYTRVVGEFGVVGTF